MPVTFSERFRLFEKDLQNKLKAVENQIEFSDTCGIIFAGQFLDLKRVFETKAQMSNATSGTRIILN